MLCLIKYSIFNYKHLFFVSDFRNQVGIDIDSEVLEVAFRFRDFGAAVNDRAIDLLISRLKVSTESFEY